MYILALGLVQNLLQPPGDKVWKVAQSLCKVITGRNEIILPGSLTVSHAHRIHRTIVYLPT